MSLDPQIAALIEALDTRFPPVHTMTGAQARATIRSRFVPPTEPEKELVAIVPALSPTSPPI